MSTGTLAALNGYAGNSIWQDVIMNLPGYDEGATGAAEWETDAVAAAISHHRDSLDTHPAVLLPAQRQAVTT